MAATERLIVRKGGNVSTSAIARAAGIAEGTIFRVFPTKEAIVDAIFEDAFNREAGSAELSAIDLKGDLECRMIAIVSIMQRRIRRIQALFGAVGFRRPPLPRDHKMSGRPDLAYADLAAILEPDSDRLRVPPLEAARLLLGVAMALMNPMLGGRSEVDPEEIVNLVLNGIAVQPASPPPPKDSSC